VIRTNLSTKPFYNERAVRIGVGLVTVVAVVATIFNTWRVVFDSRSDTELKMQAVRNEARAAEVRAEAAQLRASVDTSQIASVALDASRANALIDRRMFSWSELFSRFESALPPDVRITSVSPTIGEDRRIVVGIAVVAGGVDDVDAFMRNMEKSGAFADLLSREERVNDQGQIEASLDAVYRPGRVDSATSGPTAGSAP